MGVEDVGCGVTIAWFSKEPDHPVYISLLLESYGYMRNMRHLSPLSLTCTSLTPGCIQSNYTGTHSLNTGTLVDPPNSEACYNDDPRREVGVLEFVELDLGSGM